MIRLQRITTADTDLYSYMEKLMTQSFPSEEYRELEELRKYTDTKTHFYNNIIFHNNTPVGLITYWDFGHFYYIEHFAIDPTQRNGGYGKSVLNHLWEKPYQQPPYKTGDNYLPMLIMAYGDIECGKDFDSVKEHIYREVYNVKS